MKSYEEIMYAINPHFSPSARQEPVIRSKDSSLLVVAGAGSGKTRTMANRIAYCVGTGMVAPHEVLGLTFTRKAAAELQERVDASLQELRRKGILHPSHEDGDDDSLTIEQLNEGIARRREELLRPTISTYNSFGSDLVSMYGVLVGASASLRLITEAERWQLMEEVVDEYVKEAPHFDPGEMKKNTIIERSLMLAAALVDNESTVEEAREFYRSRTCILEEIIADAPKRRKKDKPGEDVTGWNDETSSAWTKLKNTRALRESEQLLGIVEKFYDVKKQRGIIDFSDQISMAVNILSHNTGVGKELSKKYRLVLLDEYQDTSSLQSRMLSLSLGYSFENEEKGLWRSVCAVGDPNQAIYGWRGASANAFADFPRLFHQLGPAQNLSLDESFRNDTTILNVANKVAEKISHEHVSVGELRPGPYASTGRVLEVRPLRRDDSYRAIALYISEVFDKVAREGRQPEVAILCRKHDYAQRAAQALDFQGIPYELVGGSSLLGRPEIMHVRAALSLSEFSDDNIACLRLLSLMNISVDDMKVLHRHKRMYAAFMSGKGKESAQITSRDVSLYDSVAFLVKQGVDYATKNGLSVCAFTRISFIQRVVSTVRAHIHMPLHELISLVADELGLTLEAQSRTEGARRILTSLESFADMGKTFALNHEKKSLRDFLAYLSAVEQHERGGNESEAGKDAAMVDSVDVNPGVVQIMTVHSAKGLEWKDLVVVPELVEGEFDDIEKRPHMWPTQGAVFPYPLRSDSAYIPSFDISRPGEKGDNVTISSQYVQFEEEELAYESVEQRRLAYVAFTRPHSELLLAGYGCKDVRDTVTKYDKKQEKAIEKRGKNTDENGKVPPVHLLKPSHYLIDGREHITPLAHIVKNWPEEYIFMCPETISRKEIDDLMRDDEHPHVGLEDIPVYDDGSFTCYPRDMKRDFYSRSLKDNSQEIPQATENEHQNNVQEEIDRFTQKWWEYARILVAEKEGKAHKKPATKAYWTASDVVNLGEDPKTFFENIQRPIPNRPYKMARIGTKVHAMIEEHFQASPFLDIDVDEEKENKPVDAVSQKIIDVY